MIENKGYGSEGASQKNVSVVAFSRDEPKETEILGNILFCGLCHSDVELLANNWNTTKSPWVPGHEAVGRVTAVGPDVRQYKIGDIVGVGSVIDSCLACAACREHWENHCEGLNGPTMMHGGYLTPGTDEASTFNTFGAWAENVVIKEDFAIRIPDGADLARVAPVMCASTDTFGPLTRFRLIDKSRLGIIGMGGAGKMDSKSKSEDG